MLKLKLTLDKLLKLELNTVESTIQLLKNKGKKKKKKEEVQCIKIASLYAALLASYCKT